jgi:two-component system phosphate regulon response regulator PhoB
MLPGVDGLDVCRLAKADPQTRDIPIIMVTARGEESDVVMGLELGADDYVAKPFSPRVLLARVRAVLRRHSELPVGDQNAILRIHNLSIHRGRHEVRLGGTPVDLTATEFRLLQCLAQRPGWVMTRNQIIEALHGAGYPVTDRAVDVQIAGLRKKLGDAGKLIETVRGIGYRMRGRSEER